MSSKINLVVRLQNWMDSVPGQTFLNYAYSWGASIVILGALFKLTHLPGGNVMLFLGMGTEVIVFFLSAFDRPFDKTADGKDLPDDFETDEQMEVRMGLSPAPVVVANTVPTSDEPQPEGDEPQPAVVSAQPAVAGGQPAVIGGQPAVVGGQSAVVGGQSAAIGGGAGGGTIIIGGGSGLAPAAATGVTPAAPPALDAVAEAKAATQAALAQLQAQDGDATMDAEAKRLAEIIRLANDELLRRAQAVLSPEMEDATQQYVAKLQQLNDTLAKVDEQSARLTRDSQEMENLNRTLIGINKIYDLHFASISKQVTTIEDINEQTKQLAQKIEEVNSIYARMMTTLGVMANPAAAAAAAAAPATPSPSAEA